MFVDMGQADATLRMRPISDQGTMCWTIALTKAAASMGFGHYMDVPQSRKAQLHDTARAIRATAVH